ncbi:MAG: MerR family transcriptional regulator, heat shock protein HspR [Actinomycetota bacterium]|jgi:DNA-binding transcriptional MerR regulator|nr:MerR family transcriptional regulator, heat shock protein HspR [Actinomycetota bacterium]
MTPSNVVPGPERGVYAISVAAELVGMGPQTLRLYERRGLLEPVRSGGGTRRYSSEDLERLRRIAHLVATGMNLTGVGMVLDLQDRNARLQADLDEREKESPLTEHQSP